jgi:hypothetical protein
VLLFYSWAKQGSDRRGEGTDGKLIVLLKSLEEEFTFRINLSLYFVEDAFETARDIFGVLQ